jgi:hypothetical protein
MGVARSAGTYERTRDGSTFVWNNHPKPGDEATWSGGRDREGYARGFGTLIWYTKKTESAELALYARYWGQMIRGKLSGPVNVHSKKKTHYAIFTDGARMTHWSAGTAPSGASAKWRAMIARRNAISEPSFDERSGVAEPEPPAAGPSFQKSAIRSRMPEVRDRSERRPLIDIDDSLRLLVWPPRLLRTRPGSNATPGPQ